METVLQEVERKAEVIRSRNTENVREERRLKYKELRSLGLSSTEASVGSQLGQEKYKKLVNELHVV